MLGENHHHNRKEGYILKIKHVDCFCLRQIYIKLSLNEITDDDKLQELTGG
jgi:hypothetical protein